MVLVSSLCATLPGENILPIIVLLNKRQINICACTIYKKQYEFSYHTCNMYNAMLEVTSWGICSIFEVHMLTASVILRSLWFYKFLWMR